MSLHMFTFHNYLFYVVFDLIEKLHLIELVLCHFPHNRELVSQLSIILSIVDTNIFASAFSQISVILLSLVYDETVALFIGLLIVG